jgi:hypothetical protein
MTIAWVADCHIGNHGRFGGEVRGSINDRCQLVLDTFTAACRIAADARCAAFVVAGDLFDYARPEAPIIRAVQRSLKLLKDAGCKPFLMVGNHDQTSTAAGDHALAPLAPYAAIVEKPLNVAVDGHELLLVPFQPGRAKDWLPGAVRALLGAPEDAGAPFAPPKGRRVLGLHLGIRDAKTAPWLSAAPDAIDAALLSDLCMDAGIANVIAGNWHDRRHWEFFHVTDPAFPAVEILQLGALVPTGWDNPGMDGYGTLALLDAGKVTIKEIAGPRFVKCMSTKEAKVATVDARKRGHRLYVSMSAPPEDLDDCTTWGEGCRERGEIAACEVLPDRTLAKEEAKNAAAAARGAETVDAALASFIEHMPLPDHVNRSRVLARAAEYLK